MLMCLGETFGNKKLGFHSVVSQNEITYVLKYQTICLSYGSQGIVVLVSLYIPDTLVGWVF